MEPELIPYFLGLIAILAGCAVMNCKLWRGGAEALPVALLIGAILIAAMCYLIGEGTPGFLGGLGWILAAMAIAGGPALGLLIGLILGAILGRYPATAPSEKAAP